MAPINKNPNMARKPTGTVPKTTSSSTSSSTIAGTTTIKQSTNSTKSSSSRKNTEIVAPTRRELNDLNDYLLSVAESTKQQNSGGHPHLDSSCFELENLNFQENQRFCWPVRPIPRRNIFNKDISDNHPTVSGNNLPTTTAAPTSNVHLSSNYHINNNSSNIPASSTTSASNVNSAAAVGVVIPTTPSTSVLEDNYNFSRLNLPNSNTINNHQSHSNTDEHNSNQQAQHLEFDGDLTWDQRLKFIQYFLSLTSKSTNKASDTRAQSVTSIHTLSGPTTPTYDELQTKLESSNRNIQNIKEQQQQLLRLQQTAKQHLTEMEQISSQAKRGAHYNQNGTAPPEYETVEQVHSDMSNLVNRMKNLTTFIQGQHELSALLGEDGPEILAEQEALQRKLEELKNQRQEMKNLVTELQEINSVAEKSCQNQEESSHPRVVPVEYQRVVPIELIGAVKSQGHSPVLNGHYQQQNGIHHNGVPSSTTSDEATNEQDEEEDPAEVAEANDMIRQKMADINAMKNQLKRLKDMMETVRLIEEKGDGKDPKDIGVDPQENAESHQELPKIFNSNEQPSSGESERTEALSAEEEMMTEKVRLLQEMTQDLREQAVHLATERDRLKSIKDEMKKRKDGGNKTSNREISPATMMNNTQIHKETEKQLLKAEYENKKKEFDKICQRLQSEEEPPREEIDEALHESEINSREQEKREAATYYSENWRRPHVISANSSVHGGGKHPSVPLTPTRGKESADSGAADIHGIASLEAGSLQSGSSRSFSMPPPMRTINTRDTPWRKTSQDNSQIQFDHYAPVPSLLPNWNSYYHYNIPYSQPFSPHQYHSSSAGDCICTNQFNSSSLSNGPSNSQPPVPTPGGGVNSNDPVLLQQFIHTQQMLINSVCQCNQLLWHQQREINSLNNAVLLLQQRLLNSTVIGSQEITSIASGARAESVPPNNVSNNLYNSSSRAPSETPHLPPAIPPQPSYHNIQPTVSPRQFQTYNCCNSFQHRRNVSNVQQQNHHHSQSSHAATYNYASAEQGVVFGANNLCSQLPPPHGQVPYNNLAHPPQQQQQQQPSSNYLNNDAPNTVNILPQHASPPIFMRHHNNTISSSGGIQQGHHHANNNSNLLSSQQNCLNSSPIANGSQAQTGSVSVPNSSSNAAASALNNQVAPGNRANNYWDNFRSYSRQNLLSSNSCKSNEEQNQQQVSPSAFGANATVNTNFNGMRNLQHLNGSSSGNSSANSNNLTPPIFDNKYFHTFRNQINSNTFGQHQQQQQHHSHPSLGAGCNITAELSHGHGMTSVNNMENLEQQSDVCVNQPQNSNQQALSQHDNSNINEDLYNLNNNSSSNNNNSSNSTAVFGSPDFRNMNFNFGFNELKKKIPFKTSCNTKRLRATQSAPLNDYNLGNQRFISIDELAAATSMIDDNFNPHHIPQHITNAVNGSLEDDGIQSEGAVGIDETSDEIKRNLLFNALKNDKFTSKFFETLKEDVYREIYAIIQATESQPHYLIQLFKELQLVSTSDPLRNIIMQAMHDLYKRCTNDTESSDGYNDLDFPSDNSDSVNHFNTTSSLQNNNNNDSLDDNGLLNLENNRDNEVLNSLVNSQELRRLAYKIMFESTSPSRVGKGKKSGGKCDTTLQQDTAKIGNEFYRPDYELVNHVITNIRSVIRCQHIDDGTMIRIAKLTFSSLENVTSTIGRNNIRIDRSLISPKELYRKMKTFNTRDRENFLSYYESYLQTVFVMKIVNEDANNVNLANKKLRENTSGLMSPANALPLTNEDVLQLRRHAQVSKSNIPIIASEELNLVLPEGRKTTENESAGISITGHFQTSQQTGNPHQSQQENLINADELGIIFNNPPSNIVQEQVTSPGTASSNIMNEDLAEADQICSTNSSVVTPLAIPGSARSSFSSDQPGKRTPYDGHLNNREIPKHVENEDCSHSIGASHHSYNPSSSAMNRESLEDGYDGLAFGKFHPNADQSSSETLATGNSDAPNSNNDAHSVVGEAACALVFPMIANESTLVNSENCAMLDNSSDINTSAGGNCGTGTGKRNSVP